MNLAIKILLSSIELTTLIVLSLSIFRFQFYYYLHKIYGTALLMSIVSFYFRDVIKMGNLSILSTISIEVILIMIIYRIPFFYSLLLSLIGYISGIILELSIILTGTYLKLFNEIEIQESALSLGLVQLSTAIVIIFITYLLQRRKIGFVFKTKYLTSRNALKGYNFVVSALLIVSIVLVQIELNSFYSYSLSYYLSIIIAISLLIGIYVAYRHNKKIIRETYERPVKDELFRSRRNENRQNNT